MRKKNKGKRVTKTLLALTLSTFMGLSGAGAAGLDADFKADFLNKPLGNVVLNAPGDEEYPLLKDGDVIRFGDVPEYQTESPIYRIKADRTSVLKFTYKEPSIYDLKIIDESTGKTIFRKAYNEKDNLPIYVNSGSYRVECQIDRFSAGYGFSFSMKPVEETCPETKTKNNDSEESADQLYHGRYYEGVITANEYDDIYKFTSNYDGVSTHILVESTDGGAYIEWYAYKEGCTDPDEWIQGNIDWPEKNVYLSKGTYYLHVHQSMKAQYEGQYHVWIDQKSKDIPDVQDTEYLTVGGSHILEANGLIRYKLTYEPWDPSLVRVDSVFTNIIHGEKAGSTDLYAYGTSQLLNKTSNVYQKIPVVVEFKDVLHASVNGKDPYYYDAVYWAANEGITGGVKNSKTGLYDSFNPQGNCTRAQMISFLWRMSGCPEPSREVRFRDVPKNHYAYKAVAWAQEKGITGGYSDNTFRPNGNCSRAQAVTFLYRLAGRPEVKVDPSTGFKDIHMNDGKYYNNAVVWAAQSGITGGYSDNTFRPDNLCTRCQMVTFLNRYENRAK